jgi:hypothetical protein
MALQTELIKKQIENLEPLHFALKVEQLNLLRDQHGDVVMSLFQDYIDEQVADEWSTLSAIYPRRSIEELVDIQWEHISRSGGLEFTIETQPQKIQLMCTQCPWADMAISLNATDWGYIAYCSRSYQATKSFNPEIVFTRSKTLMQGHDFCNHCYTLKTDLLD